MIRLLCAGLGGMGHGDWASAKRTGAFALVGGVDVSAEARAVFEKENQSPTFEDFGEALAAVQADAALIATPDAFHAPFSIQALEKGLDVICEKPMAATLADARRMHETAERNGRMLMIHHQLRWAPPYRHARRLIADGAIGRLRSMEFDMYVYSDVCLSGYRSKLSHLMLKDLGIHHVDLIRYLAGEECASVYTRSWNSNEERVDVPATTNVYAVLEMTGPVTVCYRSKMRAIVDATGYGSRAEITGSLGCLQISWQGLTLQTYENYAYGKEPEQIEPDKEGTDCWAAFARAIETREPALTASGDNLKSLQVMYAAIESADSGQAVVPGGGD